MAPILYERGDLDAKPNSILKQVIVYRGRAQVFRSLRSTLAPGMQEITFTALGREIEEDNIKASLSDARARIISVTLVKKDLYFFNRAENEKTYGEVVDCLKELIALADRKTILAVEAGLIAELRAYLERALNGVLLEQDVAVTRLREALDFLRGLLDRNRDDAVASESVLSKAVERYQRLSAALERIRAFDRKVVHEIRLDVESPVKAEAEAEVSYTLGGASWSTSYDAALSGGGDLVLSVYGEIAQAGGEDWENARIILSSAETETGIDIPAIHPLGLSGRAEKVSQDIVAADEDVSDLTPEGGEGQVPRQLEPDAGAEKRGTAYVFTLPRAETIPCDGKTHRLLIRRDALRPALCFETAPALMEYVYLKAEFANAAEAPLLPGPAAVFRNGSYIGRTEVCYTAPGERCALSFGIDLDIKVKRIVLREGWEPPRGAGLMRQRRESVIRYILSTYKDRPVTVTLKEAVPVSEVEKIKVRIEDDTSPGYELDRDGIVVFKKEIPPGKLEHTPLLLHYSTEAPKSMDLQGI